MALAVSGCGLMPKSETTTTAAATPAPAPAVPSTAVARVSPQPAPLPAPLPAQPDPAPPAKIYPEPAHLSGLDGSRVLALLGVPNLKRQDDPAEIWQYQTPACTLHLFLYRTAKGKDYTVRHFETRVRGPGGGRGRGQEKITAKACFSGLLRDRENHRPG